MAINRIVTQKELNYIETLYLYANLETFLSYKSTALDWLIGEEVPNTVNGYITPEQVRNMYDEEKYLMMLEYVQDTLLHSAKFLGSKGGRDWYELESYRLGIMPFGKAKKANQFNVEIQYKQSHMFSLGEKLKGLELPFGDELSKYHIRRIDISQIVKTPYDYLTNKKYISNYRVEDRITKNGIVETVYLGHRKNGNVFRMYNKSIELLTDTKDHPIDHKKIELFSRYFGDVEDLYTFELELHRKYLKANYEIDTLDDLEKVYKVYHEIVGKIGIYDDNDANKALVNNNHRDRLELVHFTEYQEYKRINKKRYKPSKYYAIDKAVHAIIGYEKSMGNLTNAEKLLIIDDIANKILDKDIDIHISESEYDEMQKKHARLRVGNDLLQSEANRAFGEIRKPKNIIEEVEETKEYKPLGFYTPSLF